jgi:hypothetical protein
MLLAVALVFAGVSAAVVAHDRRVRRERGQAARDVLRRAAALWGGVLADTGEPFPVSLAGMRRTGPGPARLDVHLDEVLEGRTVVAVTRIVACSAPLRGVAGWFTVRRKNPVDRLMELFVSPAYAIEDSRFQERLTIFGDAAPERVADVMSRRGRSGLLMFEHRLRQLHTDFATGTLAIALEGHPESFADLELLVDCASELARGLARRDRGAGEPGVIRILQSPAAGSGGISTASACLVCRQPLDGAPVTACATCDTLHHADCWVYVGGCSVFACGGRRARPAGRAA